MTATDQRRRGQVAIATKQQRVAADLRRAINRGDFPPGAHLGSEADLGDRYGVSRITVRAALAILAHEGLIASESGRGWFVRERAPLTYYASRAERANRPRSETDAYVEEVQEAGRAPSQDFSMSIEAAPAIVAERLNIAEGDLAVRRRCMRYVDGQSWSDQNSWYPMDVAQEAGLNVPHDIAGGTIRAMANIGHTEIGHVDELTARMPTPDEAHTFELGPGDPVLVYSRTAYTDRRPVRLTLTTFAADRNRVVYELGDLRGKP